MKTLTALLVLLLATSPLFAGGPIRDDGRIRLGKLKHRRWWRDQPTEGGVDWLQFSDGADAELSVTAGSMSQVAQTWRARLPEPVDGSPVLVANVLTLSGWHDLVIATTTLGRTIALDSRNGLLVWSTQPPAGPRWTTSSPAVDPSRRFVYSYALDGYVHK